MDGEMSEPRSTRDMCIGAFVTGLVGIASLLLTLDWDFSLKQGRHPILWTVILCSLTAIALAVAALAQMFIRRTRTRSAYSRVVGMIRRHFKLEDTRPLPTNMRTDEVANKPDKMRKLSDLA